MEHRNHVKKRFHHEEHEGHEEKLFMFLNNKSFFVFLRALRVLRGK